MAVALSWMMAEPLNLVYIPLAALFAALLGRIIYMQVFHPLSSFHGPWYATSFSIVGAIISVQKREHLWYMHLVKKYGGR